MAGVLGRRGKERWVRIDKRNRRPYVNHDSLVAELPQRFSRADSAPVELDGAANSIDTAAKN